MRGGWNFYHGSAAGAAKYFREGHEGAETYFTEAGREVAQVVSWREGEQVGSVRALADGELAQWIEGVDPETGEVKGVIRPGVRADGSRCERQPLRFVEFSINNPKSLSILESQDPAFHAVMEGVRDRQQAAMTGYLSKVIVTRVGPKGAQSYVGGLTVQAAHVRHMTSREGDPHYHRHVFVNSRVLTGEGEWRGLDTSPMRQHVRAVNAVGERVLQTDRDLHDALAERGMTLGVKGVNELAGLEGVFSKRTVQINANREAIEAGWRVAHPGEEPGYKLRNRFKAQAWNLNRKGKSAERETPEETAERIRVELAEHGYDLRTGHHAGIGWPEPVQSPVSVAQVDRDMVAVEALAVLSASRSTWTEADLSAAVEQAVTDTGVVGDRQAVAGLVDDVRGRARQQCVSVLDDETEMPTPASRHLTSRAVIDADTKLNLDLAGLAADGIVDGAGYDLARSRGRDLAQAQAVAAIGSARRLEVVIGPAGAGKTTVLGDARERATAQGRTLLVVTPTAKAAEVAGGIALHKLLYENGWRWDHLDRWTRLTPGQVDPETGRVYTGPADEYQLTPASVVVVDEAGMVSVDTHNALSDLAGESGAAIRLMGDPYQLGAVGRGGVMATAARYVAPVELVTVHRFGVTVINEAGVAEVVTDTDYAALSLDVRRRADTTAVAAAVMAHSAAGISGHGRVVGADDPDTAIEDLAGRIVGHLSEGETVAAMVGTNDLARRASEVVRDRRVRAGQVDDTTVTAGREGVRIGVGDLIVTRQNEREGGVLKVANRQTWTVETVQADGSVTAHASDDGRRRRVVLTGEYLTDNVELGYVTTDYGAQGVTVDHGYLLVTDATVAGGLYVGITRGTLSNTIITTVGPDRADQQEQLQAALSRDRADVGLDAAIGTARTHAQNIPAGAELVAAGAGLGGAGGGWGPPVRPHDPEARSDLPAGGLEPAISASHDREREAGRGIPPVTERLSKWETVSYRERIKLSQAAVSSERERIIRRTGLAKRPTLTPKDLAAVTAAEAAARHTFTTKREEMVAAEVAAAEHVAAEHAAWVGREADPDATDRQVIAGGPGGRFAGRRRQERLGQAIERVQGRAVTDDRYRAGEAEHRLAAERLTTDPLTGRAIDPDAQAGQVEASGAYATAERARHARLDHDQAVTINAQLDRRRDRDLAALEARQAKIDQQRQALANLNAWRATATPEQIAAADKERTTYLNRGRGRSGRDDYDQPVTDNPPSRNRPGPTRTPDPYYHHEVYEPRQDRGLER